MLLKDFSEKMDKEIDFLINFIAEEIKPDPKDHFSSKSKIRKHVKQNLVIEEIHDQFRHGLSLIMNYLQSHLNAVEFDEVANNLNQVLDKMVSLAEQKEKTMGDLADKINEAPDTLQEIFGFSDNTIDRFYQAGLHSYNTSHFKEASDIFNAISLLAPTKFNVWLALGMAEKQAGHYEKALRAFAMATLVDIDTVVPHIHSAECYLQLHDKSNAKNTFEYALNLIHEHPDKNSKQDENYIRSALNKHFSK